MTIIFKAKTAEGYTIKVLSELLQNVIKTACLEVHDKGIDMCMMDSRCRILVNIVLHGSDFNIYEISPTVTEKMYLGINLSHFYKMLKSIKKKDALMLLIDDEEPDKLNLIVYPKEKNRVSEAKVHIQAVQNIAPQMPTGYTNPVIIPSGDYQRTIKDMNNIGDTIIVKMKKYSVSIACSADGIYSRKVLFGEMDDKSNEYYCESFDMEQFMRILKASGLSKNLKMFSGKTNIPLCIVSKIGNLGNITIYIKSQDQIRKESMKE